MKYVFALTHRESLSNLPDIPVHIHTDMQFVNQRFSSPHLVLLQVRRHSPVGVDIGKVELPAQFQYSCNFPEHRSLVRGQVDDAVRYNNVHRPMVEVITCAEKVVSGEGNVRYVCSVHLRLMFWVPCSRSVVSLVLTRTPLPQHWGLRSRLCAKKHWIPWIQTSLAASPDASCRLPVAHLHRLNRRFWATAEREIPVPVGMSDWMPTSHIDPNHSAFLPHQLCTCEHVSSRAAAQIKHSATLGESGGEEALWYLSFPVVFV